MQWYYSIDGQSKGPVEDEIIRNLVRSGGLMPNHYVWNETMGDKWSRISESKEFSSAVTLGERFAQKADFKEKFAERIASEQKARMIRKLISLAVLLALVAVGYGIFWFIKTAPMRQWGITSSAPIGSFAIIDEHLRSSNKMEKVEIRECKFVKKLASRMFTYSNPKAEHGQFVSIAGSMTLLVDENDRLTGLVAAFPTPGAHAGIIINDSFVSLFAYPFWSHLSGQKEKQFDFKKTDELSNEDPGLFGLGEFPKGNYATFKNDKATGILVQYGKGDTESLMYLRAL